MVKKIPVRRDKFKDYPRENAENIGGYRDRMREQQVRDTNKRLGELYIPAEEYAEGRIEVGEN